VAPLSGGWDTSLWRVDDADERTHALRVFRAEQVDTCRREAVVMRALIDFGLPVPRVHAEGTGQGRPALLLSWCPGGTILQHVQARPWRVWRLAIAMGRMHARVHAMRVSDALAQALPAWTPRADDFGADLQAQQRAVSVRSPSVLHLDYHPLNVMSDGRAVTGILDWANVAVGDRRADLARTVTLLRLAPTPRGTPANLLLGVRGMLEAGWRYGYRQHSGSDAFVDMDLFYVWAGAMMERDLRPKLGRPGVWLRESDLVRIRRWTAGRALRIGRT
jgi:aminoglycoside phosphotransferase (APT) family kinase protein